MNVHDEGNVLEIVGMCCKCQAFELHPLEKSRFHCLFTSIASHGTHVASIAAGNHKSGQEELNGVAPGAKIVSLTIGDGRLGSVQFIPFLLVETSRIEYKLTSNVIQSSNVIRSQK